jgi:NAD(P)-dependent dehydrogenase (short-subunit alcohol dehydrogenase family)
MTTKPPQMQEIVVITGASSGIGRATVREMARRGFHVLAGVRRDQDADAIRGEGIEPVILDITNADHVRALAHRVNEDSQGRAMRALVNNAGVGVNAPIEVFGIEEWRRLFEVNLFGHMDVTQKLLPVLIRSKGRVVNISSVGGKIAMATYGPYAGAKFALEAASDALRREIDPLGVKVIVVEPGAVTTEMLGRVGATGDRIISEMTPEQQGRYAALMHAVIAQAKASIPGGAAPEAAGLVIADAITSERPRTRYTVGRDAAIVVRLARFLSDRMLDRVLAAALRPYLPKESKG